jgi:conjugative transfer signal peptidase TraF
MNPTPSSQSLKLPSSCASTGARSTTCAGEAKARRSGAMAAASSTIATNSSHGPSSVAPGPRQQRNLRSHQLSAITIIGLAVLAIACPKLSTPRLIWNISPSVPTGLYWLIEHPPPPGALAVIHLPEPLLALPVARGYLPAAALLIKRVAGQLDDVVCRHGSIVTINRQIVAYARTADAAGRPLPRWSGCNRLNGAQAFVLSAEPGSFDSRYFGPVDRRYVLGTALPIWTLAPVGVPSPSADDPAEHP